MTWQFRAFQWGTLAIAAGVLFAGVFFEHGWVAVIGAVLSVGWIFVMLYSA